MFNNNNINKKSSDQIQTVKFTSLADTEMEAPSNLLEPTFMLADTSDTVQGFFSRPQRIFSAEWVPNVAFHETFNPWQLYFGNNKVAERLANFYLLRCKLHIRILVNGTVFYYGRLLASYRPLHLVDSVTLFRDGVQADFVEASQRPHVIINPSEDTVGEMLLPYLHPKSGLIIPLQEWNQMGEITISDLNVLKNANDVTDPLTVSVFAWAQEVSYSQPTSSRPPIPNQGELEDTLPAGIVSRPATALARIAANFVNAPFIGSYARATEMGAKTVANIAALFGYSSPRNLSPILPVINRFGQFANIDATDYCATLALDSKHEVTIDPRVAGCEPCDPMAFLPIVTKETYLTTIDWDVNDAPDILLYNFRVNPLNYSLYGSEIHLTPPAWISVPFQYWRGSLNYRFEVVASKFHRGRLRLAYDPYVQQTAEFNVNYSQIVDIADGYEFTMKVGWAQGVPYLTVPSLNFQEPYHRETQYTTVDANSNGILSLFVLNSLTVPNELDKHVSINVYVSACDDFEVCAPRTGQLEGILPLGNGINPLPVNPPGVIPMIPGTYSHISQPDSDRVPPEKFKVISPTPILVGSSNATVNFNGNNLLRFDELEPQTSAYDLSYTLLTDAPSGTELVIGGVNYVVPPPRSGISRLDLKLAVPANATIQTVTIEDLVNIPPAYVLAVDNIRAPFAYPSNVVTIAAIDVTNNTGTIQTSVPAPDPNTGNSYIELVPGAEATISGFVTGRITKFMARSRGPGLGVISFTNILDNAVVNIPIADSVVPVQPAVLIDFVTNQFVVRNSSATQTIEFHSFTIDGIQNQGDIETTEVAGPSDPQSTLAQIFMGESVQSIRQLLKRYTITKNIKAPSVLAGESSAMALRAMPLGDSLAQLESGLSLWDWFVPAFLGWKGSIRIHVHSTPLRTTLGAITRAPDGAAVYGSFTRTEEPLPVTWAGTFLGTTFSIPLRAEVPWYSNMRFLPSRAAPNSTYYAVPPTYQFSMSRDTVSHTLSFSNAAGEDFSVYYFVSTPVITPSP
ncbi:putative capsid protein [Freshwater macrophyte associated picorna-like virus 8]|nr:putative capsid protein [Freshwater macrophyte associated picorna-like virus 8]